MSKLMKVITAAVVVIWGVSGIALADGPVPTQDQNGVIQDVIPADQVGQPSMAEKAVAQAGMVQAAMLAMVADISSRSRVDVITIPPSKPISISGLDPLSPRLLPPAWPSLIDMLGPKIWSDPKPIGPLFPPEGPKIEKGPFGEDGLRAPKPDHPYVGDVEIGPDVPNIS